MPSLLPLAQMGTFRTDPVHIAVYVGLALTFLFLVWLTDQPSRPFGTTLVLWGLLVIVFSCGYSLLATPLVMAVTPELIKVGFLLILGGITLSALTTVSPRSNAKDADHV